MKYPLAEHLNYTVIRLSGEIDLSESPNVRKQLLDTIRKNQHLLVDLSAVDYIDSSGVACLVEGLQTARALHQTFALVGVSHAALQVLKLARLDSVFDIYASLEEVTE